MGKKLLLSFGCPFWQLVAFPPCSFGSPHHSCQIASVLITQYSSSTCYLSLLLQCWLPWACTAGTSCITSCLPEGHGWSLCWSLSTFSMPAHALFPSAFLWLCFSYLISGQSPRCGQAWSLPLLKDCLQPGWDRQVASALVPFWDLVCSSALVLTSAIPAPAQKGHRPSWLHHSDTKSPLVLSSALQPKIFNFLEIQERKNIRWEDKQAANFPFSWIYVIFLRKFLSQRWYLSYFPLLTHQQSQPLNKW